MSAKFARIAKYAVVPVFAVVFASGGSALVGAHGASADHRSDAGVAHAKDSTAPNSPEPSPSVSPSPDAAEHDATEHDVARFHGDATACPQPDGAALEGNWTHGDYVSAWAKTGDHAKTQAAARSDCGKPQSSVHAAKSDDDKADEADDAGEDAGAHDSHAAAHRQDGDHKDEGSEHGANHGDAGGHGGDHEAGDDD
jgi:hypothetical protein